MSKINLEKERGLLDRDITFFHFNRAKKRIAKCIKIAKKINNNFYFFYFLKKFYKFFKISLISSFVGT
ncbi:MAG: hypothetical protein NC925_05575, partial [Candidatus Omnitrophica bacterium]|nr:hypothetical protein [Candidatus Omnitrophota bacterium]